MGVTTRSSRLATLNELLSASQEAYESCVDAVSHDCVIEGITATTRLHHLKFDGNGQPMIKALAECLYNHVIDYCIAARNRPEPLTAQDAARLAKEARKLFIRPVSSEDDPDETGEAGEILLYLLMEIVLRAPQVVAKVELKTNNSMEVHGSDGIHMAWNSDDSVVDVYFGEAKLFTNVSNAMSKAIESVDGFHKRDMCRHELKMVTKHFKYADPNVQTAVAGLLCDGIPTSDVRINHACLIGYDWTAYGQLPSQAIPKLVADFQARYVADAPRLHKLLQRRFDTFTRKHLRFEVFFLPFPSVQDFRDAFNDALG